MSKNKGQYYIEDYHDGYMVKYNHGYKIASIQWFLSKDDAETFMYLQKYDVPPWNAYQLVMGEPSARSDHPTYPPREKTYRERFPQ